MDSLLQTGKFSIKYIKGICIFIPINEIYCCYFLHEMYVYLSFNETCWLP